VILTAHGDDEARQRSLQAGAVAFLGKPFNGNALLDAVRTALNQGSRRPGWEGRDPDP
jgi:FixJ family two-component response regulator